jgi:hypothetical protein
MIAVTRVDLPLHGLNSRMHASTAAHLNREILWSRGRSGDGSRGSSWQMGPMTHYVGPIRNLIMHLQTRCRGGGSDETMRRLAAGGLDPEDAATVFELASGCAGTGDRARAERVVAGLVSLAPEDDMAALGALVALFPALIRLSRRMTAAGIDPTQADVDVLEAAFDRVVSVGGELSRGKHRRHVARSVIGGTWDRLRVSLEAEQRCALRHSPLEGVGDPVDPRDLFGDLPGLRWVLTEAVATGVIGTEAARIIEASRIRGRSLTSVAWELHKAETAVRRSRQRAERALIASRSHLARRAYGSRLPDRGSR